MPVDRMQQLRARVEENELAQTTCSGSSAVVAKLEELRKLNAQLEDAQMQHLATNDRRLAKKIERIIGDIAKEGQVARNMIVAFNHETQKLDAKKTINASERSMRQNIFENFVRKLEEVTRSSWDMQKTHDVNVTKQVEKRLRVRFSDKNGLPSMDEEDVHRIAKQLVESGAEEQVFLLARDELDKATRTRDAVREIEREMRDLYLIFCDLNTLVVEQAEGLEMATVNVQRANENVQIGRQQLVEARRLQKKCCCTM